MPDDFFYVTAADIVIAVFAALLAIFTMKLSSALARLHSTEPERARDTRAIEAIERASEAAHRSAEAAEKTVALLREASERQSRAYVSVRQFLQGAVKDHRQNVVGWALQVVWQNTGPTPTQGLRSWAMLRQCRTDIPVDVDLSRPEMKDFASGELGPGSTMTSPRLVLPQDDVLRIQAGSRRVFMVGQAEYGDVFAHDATRETSFCVELILVADPIGANAAPFSFAYYPKHNSMT